MSGIARLAYVRIEARDLDAWRRFGRDVIGCEVVAGPEPEALHLRVDERPWRLQIAPGPLDDIAVAGFEVDSEAALANILARLESIGHPVSTVPGSACAARGVRAMIAFKDPSGLAVEVSCGALMRPQADYTAPFPHGGFVTGGQGLGHLMVIVDDVPATQRFYCDVLGFVTSDYVSTPDYGGRPGDFVFMRCNARHHTMAIGSLPWPRRLGHLMLQVRELDDVGRTLDRLHAHGFTQTRSLGRHVNDRMFSFYARSPCGGQVEIGWGGLEVDDAAHSLRTYDVTSVWGHQHLGR